jgi:hypothetical protein
MTIITKYLNDIKKSVNPSLDNLIFLYDLYKNVLNEIIKKSITSTLISIFTIIVSLILIPLGDIILSNRILLVLSFSIIGILIVVCCVLYFLLFKTCIDLQELKFPINRKSNENKVTPMADVIIDGEKYH